MLSYLVGLSDEDLRRTWNCVLRRIEEWGRGDPWGWDWPTLCVCHPQWAKCLRLIRRIERMRGFACPDLP